MVVGGVAASLLGKPRLTGDVDVVIWIDESAVASLVAAGRAFDIAPRVSDAVSFARRSRMLLLRHEPSAIDLDVSLGALPFEEEMIARACRRRIHGLLIPLPTPEDLIVMKAIAHRPRDVADIESVLEANPAIDVTRTLGIVRDFATALDAPDLVSDLERLLSARKRRAPVARSAPRRSRSKP